ncbi:MAG: hypothetical protein PHW01_02530 [Patescibacteria group bacterium]|nr:hypothetical protein [Patescibacteria group bacterium]
MENLEQESGDIHTKEVERNNIDIEEIKRFYDVIGTKMRNFTRPSGKLNVEAYGRFMDFMDKLEEKYGKEELRKYAAWQAASGSSILEDEFIDITGLDLPGEDSIENFFDSQK